MRKVSDKVNLGIIIWSIALAAGVIIGCIIFPCKVG